MAKAKKVVTDGEISHGTLVTWVNEADTATTDSRATSEKCRDYYDGKQLTDAEIKALKARKQAPIVINRIKPKMDGLMGMEKSAKTTIKAFPRTPKHTMDADAASESIRYVLQDNFFDQVRSQVWEFLLLEGTGGAEVIVKPSKKGMRITLNSIPWDRLIYDPHSRSKHFTDKPRYLGQVAWMDWDDAVGMYPGKKDVLDTTISGSATFEDKPNWVDSNRKRVKLVELYYRNKGDWWHCILTYGGFVESPKISPFKNEEGETEHAYEFASAFVDREGNRYGSAKQLLDVNDEINKRRSKFLHLASVRQVMLERGAVDDVNKVRGELAKPDGVIEVTPGMLFEVLKTGDMAAAQFNLLTEAKMEIDSVGVNAALMGKDSKSASGIALQERKMAGQTELGPLFDVLKHWQHRMFRKIWNRIRQYWTDEMWIRVTDDERNVKWVGINAPITAGERLLEQAQTQGIEAPELEMLKQRIAQDPSMKEVVGKRNSVAELDVDIILSETPDSPTAEIENFQVMGEMVKSGFPLPPEAVIEASPLANKEKILRMMKEKPQLPPEIQQQMEQMGEQLKGLTQENQQLKGKQAEGIAKIQSDKEEAQAKLNLQAWNDEQEVNQRAAKQAAEAKLARDKAIADHELKIEQCGRDEALKTRQCEFDESMATRENDRKQKDQEFDRDLKIQDRRERETQTDSEMMPKILEKVEKSFAPLAEILLRLEKAFTESVKLQKQTLEAIERPKQVSLGSIQRDDSGNVSGATVRTIN